jgi:hypothetical protein
LFNAGYYGRMDLELVPIPVEKKSGILVKGGLGVKGVVVEFPGVRLRKNPPSLGLGAVVV